jgi:hypothetical protein
LSKYFPLLILEGDESSVQYRKSLAWMSMKPKAEQRQRKPSENFEVFATLLRVIPGNFNFH